MNREHCMFYGSRLSQLRSRPTHADVTPIFLCAATSCGLFTSNSDASIPANISVPFASVEKDTVFRLNVIVQEQKPQRSLSGERSPARETFNVRKLTYGVFAHCVFSPRIYGLLTRSATKPLNICSAFFFCFFRRLAPRTSCLSFSLTFRALGGSVLLTALLL